MGFKVGMPVGLQLCQGLGRVWQNDRLSMWLKMSDIDIYIYIFFFDNLNNIYIYIYEASIEYLNDQLTSHMPLLAMLQVGALLADKPVNASELAGLLKPF